MATQREVEVEWIGGLMDGEGKIMSATSGQIPELEVTWDARNDETEPKTSPEELLAAAHAAVFSMQLAHGLVGAGWDPDVITVTAKVAFELGIGITDIDAHRAGRVRRAPRRGAPRRRPSARRRRARSRRRSRASRSRSSCPTCRRRGRGRGGGRGSRRRARRGRRGLIRRRGGRRAVRRSAAGATNLAAMSALEKTVDELERSYPEAQERLSDPPSTTTTARRRRSAGA